MGKSQQTGWVLLRGKYWYGYFRQAVPDAETDEEKYESSPFDSASNRR